MNRSRPYTSIGLLAVCILSGFSARAAAQQRPFSTAPSIQMHDSDLRLGENVQKINGLFALRLLDQVPTPDLQACLRAAGDSTVTVQTYSSGSVRLRSSPGSCIDALTSRQSEDLGLETDSLQLSAARIYVLLLAKEQFDHSKFYSGNDRNLPDYDVEIYNSTDGSIDVVFSPPPQHSLIAGCPSTGLVVAGFMFDRQTYSLKPSHHVC